MLSLTKYYSTFIPGLLGPVRTALVSALPDARIITALDGLIAYESAAGAAKIQNLPFVTNSFLVLKTFPPESASTIAALAIDLVERRRLKFVMPDSVRSGKSFRIVPSVSNELVQLDNHLMQRLEGLVSENTRLRTNRAKPDLEFWLSKRSEGHGFFSLRLTYHKAYDKSLQKGELRPELANVLCQLSEPLPNELFLDPFCGSGAIPIQRAKHFPKGLVIASDIDEQVVGRLKQRIKTLKLTRRVVVRNDDALNLTRYEQGAIHKIVTDPPWGHFSQLSMSPTDFYTRMLREFGRVIRPSGRTVILVGEKEVFENALDRIAKFRLDQNYKILLSGKKASIYVLSDMSRKEHSRADS